MAPIEQQDPVAEERSQKNSHQMTTKKRSLMIDSDKEIQKGRHVESKRTRQTLTMTESDKEQERENDRERKRKQREMNGTEKEHENEIEISLKKGNLTPQDHLSSVLPPAVQPSQLISSSQASPITSASQEQHNQKIEKKSPEHDKNPTHLSLEAIFYPKFDIEKKNDKSRRRDILNTLLSSSCDPSSSSIVRPYLEITLKHSGSLLLWTGTSSFYSKNDMDNAYTLVGEILLRQHFARAWNGDSSSSSSFRVGSNAYDACAISISQRKLCISFEVVSSLLGDHGDDVINDYLIVLSIADKTTERFWSTREIVAFCHEWRLPHNDVWVFDREEAAKRVFEFYDENWETAGCLEVVRFLDGVKGGKRLKSMYPHDLYQGDILEGFVIRLVDNNGGEGEENVAGFDKLATRSEELRQTIRPDLDWIVKKDDAILGCDLRALYKRCRRNTLEMENILRKLLNDNIKERKKINRLKCKNGKDMVELANDILKSDKVDAKSKRIAKSIEFLGKLNESVKYKLYERISDSEEELEKGKCRLNQWLCMVHIQHDVSFFNYEKKKLSSDMSLFRGFCIAVHFDSTEKDNERSKISTISTSVSEDTKAPGSSVTMGKNNQPLTMLKMKLLPYLVRTAGIRNGLQVLKEGGLASYERYALNLLVNDWKCSDELIKSYQNFFAGWGRYALPLLNSSTSSSDKCHSHGNNIREDYPSLSDQTYLYHFHKFKTLYSSQKQTLPSSSPFRGIVLIVSLELNTSPLTDLSQHLCLSLQLLQKPLPSLDEIDVLSSISSSHNATSSRNGILCSCHVTDKIGAKARKLFKKYSKHFYLVVVDCSDDDLATYFEKQQSNSDGNIDDNQRKKTKGMLTMWKRLKLGGIFDVSSSPSSSSFSSTQDFCSATSTLLQRASERNNPPPKLPASQKSSPSPALLIIFPTIPGHGKSAICRTLLSSSPSPSTTTAVLSSRFRHRCGDETRQKYWPSIHTDILHHMSSSPSSHDDMIFLLADKNAPPISWSTIKTIGVETNSILWVLCPPLQTTIIDATTTAASTVTLLVDQQQKKTSLTFPFPLSYLAVCLERVLERRRCDEDKNICDQERGLYGDDSNAMIAVLKFWFFYEGLTSHGFKKRWQRELSSHSSGGYLTKNELDSMPFFHEETDSVVLPQDLKSSLIAFISFQSDLLSMKRQSEKDNESSNTLKMIEMEANLRRLLKQHSSFLRSITVPVTTITEWVLSKLKGSNSSSSSPLSNNKDKTETTTTKAKPQASNFIKIASIDIDVSVIHLLLEEKSRIHSSISTFFQSIGGLNLPTSSSSSNNNCGFIYETHITMMHYSSSSQSKIKSTFSHLLNSQVDVTIHSFLHSKDVAALRVSISEQITVDDASKVVDDDATTTKKTSTMTAADVAVPRSTNDFVHVTVWCRDGIEARMANELPKMVTEGRAEEVVFVASETSVVKGTFRFWKM